MTCGKGGGAHGSLAALSNAFAKVCFTGCVSLLTLSPPPSPFLLRDYPFTHLFVGVL